MVARYHDAHSTLRTAKAALRERCPGATQVMLAATAEFAAARRDRDAIFLRALPTDGTIPVHVIDKFGISHVHIHRLIPGLTPTNRR